MGVSTEASQRYVQGNALKCPVCGHDQFRTRQALLNRRWTLFLDFAWVDREATCEICASCGYVLWFLPPRT